MKKRFYHVKNCVVFLLIVLNLLSLNTTIVLGAQDRSANFNRTYQLTGNYINDLVAVAEAQVGKSESKSELNYTEAWCADFVNDCARLVGMPDNIIPYNWSDRAYTPSLYTHMINNCNAKKVSSPQKGDLVFYDCSKCGRIKHVGIVRDSNSSIEGNLSNKVNIATTSYTDDKGHSIKNGQITKLYLRPNYTLQAPDCITINWKAYKHQEKIRNINLKAGDTVTFGWGGVDGATSYPYAVKKLNGEPNINSTLETGPLVDEGIGGKDALPIQLSEGAGWYKFALGAKAGNLESDWIWVYVYVDEAKSTETTNNNTNVTNTSNVDNTKPSVRKFEFLGDLAGFIVHKGAVLCIDVAAMDESGIAKIILYIDGKEVERVTNVDILKYRATAGFIGQGLHRVKTEIIDNAGNKLVLGRSFICLND